MAKLPFSKDEYFQMLNSMLTIPSQTGQLGDNSPMDRLRQAVMNQVKPAMAGTAMAGTAQ